MITKEAYFVFLLFALFILSMNSQLDFQTTFFSTPLLRISLSSKMSKHNNQFSSGLKLSVL